MLYRGVLCIRSVLYREVPLHPKGEKKATAVLLVGLCAYNVLCCGAPHRTCCCVGWLYEVREVSESAEKWLS